MAYAPAVIAAVQHACAYLSMSDDRLETMGDRLRVLRESSKLSREVLAKRVHARVGRDDVGVTGQTLYRYEKGEVAMMEADRAVAIAEELGTDVRWLIEGDPPQATSEAFVDFMTRVAPTVQPPITPAERGRLVWTKFKNPTAERYFDTLLREREARAPDVVATGKDATTAAQSRADAAGIKRLRRRR